MRHCKRCVYPDTKPGLVLDSKGICQACRHAEKKKKIDWTARWQELKKLCDKYRGTNGNYYDCLITGSGGKDSHFQTVTDVCCYWIREGRITREEAKKLVEEHDHKLDPKGLKDFLEFTGYTEQEFWNIVEKFWNRDIFKKVNGKWQLQRNWT